MATLLVAIEGCCHGELDMIYQHLGRAAEKPDLLIICGDFQSVRNEKDLKCMAVPEKFKRLGDFPDYYSGAKKAPILTIFIGGNHEASNYLQELRHGGWVAPNIYYLGRSGVVWYRGLKIMGLSGIWNPQSFMKKPVKVEPPYNPSEIRSVYHVRKEDYWKMLCCKDTNDAVILSHDWPEGIPNFGNLEYLLRKKPFFKTDIGTGKLGSPVNRELLFRLKPRFWFSAHLHVEFMATVVHAAKRRGSSLESEGDKKSRVVKNVDEIELDLDDFDEEEEKEEVKEELEAKKEETPEKEQVTEFHALDKCLPRRKFLAFKQVQVTNMHHPSFTDKESLYLDEEFLCVERALQSLRSSEVKSPCVEAMDTIHKALNPTDEFLEEMYLQIDVECVKFNKRFGLDDLRLSKESFLATAPNEASKFEAYVNPQTEKYEKLLSE
ncbi:unnamed protein product [Kuraishia capsulata CBS 1993]|uniref:Lariat debranching enzyme C-terminal domain-containing protein n=1 Tax=Kuraishia capsulata CBS 1993 TaxID=1382522 RepID=W6MPQ3_9ASCO|nr:uncharacterized protein KUCA_T00004605001 [Kuraishia capsulata CBS 1993]CDK28621.1 unnamed protein product [Kuraishia capsulata CBS 1993]